MPEWSIFATRLKETKRSREVFRLQRVIRPIPIELEYHWWRVGHRGMYVNRTGPSNCQVNNHSSLKAKVAWHNRDPA
jgi:hypothetical protein